MTSAGIASPCTLLWHTVRAHLLCEPTGERRWLRGAALTAACGFSGARGVRLLRWSVPNEHARGLQRAAGQGVWPLDITIAGGRNCVYEQCSSASPPAARAPSLSRALCIDLEAARMAARLVDSCRAAGCDKTAVWDECGGPSNQQCCCGGGGVPTVETAVGDVVIRQVRCDIF